MKPKTLYQKTCSLDKPVDQAVAPLQFYPDAKTAMRSAVILLSHLLCCLAEVQKECPATVRCLPQDNCPEFREKRERYELSKDRKLLTELRSKVCDSAEKKVCCEESVDSGQCGQAQIVPANVRPRDSPVTNREICILLSDYWR